MVQLLSSYGLSRIFNKSLGAQAQVGSKPPVGIPVSGEALDGTKPQNPRCCQVDGQNRFSGFAMTRDHFLKGVVGSLFGYVVLLLPATS